MDESAHDALTDETLVERARESAQDDLRHFDTLVRRHRAQVVANCRYLTRQPEQALAVPAVAERDLIRREARDRVAAAIDALPDSLRIPLTLRDLDGLTCKEIAGQLGLNLPAAKMRILRARRELRGHLDPMVSARR